MIRGYGYGGLIDRLLSPHSGVKIVVAESHQQAFQRLLQGQADYVLDYRGPANETLAVLGQPRIAWTPWTAKDLYFIVSKQLSQPGLLLAELEDALAAVEN